MGEGSSASIQCEVCGESVVKGGPNQRYCPRCSQEKRRETSRLWARNHPKEYDPSATKAKHERRTAALREAGAARSEPASLTSWIVDDEPLLGWCARIAVPFDYSMSKNAIWRNNGAGHVLLRRESNAASDLLASAFTKIAAACPVVQNKVWLDIMVEKPNHRGDAVNVVDFVADAVKVGLGIDDRWFCIRRLDWRVVKINPRLIIGVGQEIDAVDSQVCSYCGRIIPLVELPRNNSTPTGRGRTCRECTRARARLAKQAMASL